MYIDIHSHFATLSHTVVSRSKGRPWPDSPLFSAGLHPWFLDDYRREDARLWLLAQAALPGCVAIGEAGLDKLCATPAGVQRDAFLLCADTAEALQLPLVIHCVRAFDEILALKKQYSTPWIFHGFNKKEAIARQVLHTGAFLSFGKAILRPDSPAAAALRLCPDDRFFLETDDCGACDIAAIYTAAAQIKGLTVAQTAELVAQNYQKIFTT